MVTKESGHDHVRPNDAEKFCDWTYNEEMAHKVFDFFGSFSMGVSGGGLIAVVGEVGGTTLILLCPQEEPRTIGLQYKDRTENERQIPPVAPGLKWKGNVSVLLENCLGLTFNVARRSVRITGDVAVVIVTESDILCLPRTSFWE